MVIVEDLVRVLKPYHLKLYFVMYFDKGSHTMSEWSKLAEMSSRMVNLGINKLSELGIVYKAKKKNRVIERSVILHIKDKSDKKLVKYLNKKLLNG